MDGKKDLGEQLRIWLTPEQATQVKGFCDLMGINYSKFFRIAGEHYINSIKEKLKNG